MYPATGRAFPYRCFVVATAVFAIAGGSPCQEPAPPLDGYVTRTASASDFDVNGFHVLLTGATRIERNTTDGSSTIAVGDMKLYVGLPIQVLGNIQHKSHSITATKLTLLQGELRQISTAGVIDGVLPASSHGDHLIRADGYLVLISAATAATFNPPLDNTSAFQVNVGLVFRALNAGMGSSSPIKRFSARMS